MTKTNNQKPTTGGMHAGEQVDEPDLRESREQAGQEDRGERRVVKDDVALVLVREETAEAGDGEEDLRRTKR